MKRLAITGLIGTALTACQPVVDPVPQSRFDDDPASPHVALLEHVLAEHFAQQRTRPVTTCAKMPDDPKMGDSERAFMLRFTELAPLERCEWREGRYVDAMTGGDARVFAVQRLQCSDDTRCEAYAGWTAANLGAEYQQYILTWNGSVWRIEAGNLRIMS